MGRLRFAALVAIALTCAAGCDIALPRVNPIGDTAVVNLVWENNSDRRYFLTIGDLRDNTLSRWFVVEPCQRAGVWGVQVTLPDDIGFAEAGADNAPSGPVTGAVDSATLADHSTWVFQIVQEDPPDDMIGNLFSYGPSDRPIAPFEPEALC
jgi:hypothetical protein